jgi:O-antigen/teichoic acid export membrane protein
MAREAPSIHATDLAHAGRSREADEASRGSAVKLAAEILGRLLSVATTLVAARLLGVEAFGVFAALSGAAVIVAEAADLGLLAAAARDLVAGSAPLRGMLRAKLALSTVVGLAALALSPAWPLLAALVAYFVLAGWTEFLGVALRARGARLREAWLIVAGRAAALACALPALVAGGGPLGLAAALAASTVPAIALGGAFLLHTPARVAEAPDPGVVPLLRSSLPLGVNGGLALVCLRLEVMLLGWLRGGGPAGAYAAALRLVEPLLLVPGAVAGGAMPHLTREALSGAGPVRERTALTGALLAVPAAAGLALVGPSLLVLLLGEAYAPAAAPLRILALALPALFMNAILLHALIAAGRPAWLPRLTGVRLALAAALALWLVPRFGASGAAAGFVGAEAALLLAAARASGRARFPVPVARPLLLGALASVPMAIVVAAAAWGPLASVAIGVLVYAATLSIAWRCSLHVRYS